MRKKPIIITVAIVAAAAILIGGGIYLYPHLVERTISEVVKNDMTDVVKIELANGNNGRRVEITDKEDIEEIVELVKNLKGKKRFDQYVPDGYDLSITMTTSEGEKISLSSWNNINGVMYSFNESEKGKRDEIRNYIIEKYDLEDWPEEDTVE